MENSIRKVDKWEKYPESDKTIRLIELMPIDRVGLAKVNAGRCRRAAELYEEAGRLYRQSEGLKREAKELKREADGLYTQARMLEEGVLSPISQLSEMLNTNAKEIFPLPRF